MKFGKLIWDARDLSMPEWRSKWMDYKALKAILKSIPMKPETVGSDELANQLSNSPTEVSFFTLLKEELKKVSEFYLSSESSMLESYKAMVTQLNAYKERLRRADESEAMSMLGSVVKFYMDLLLLENFAVINYCGFGKILKKHDKVTGYVTKEAYMQRMVNPQEFTHYPRLMRMLRYTEQSYQLLLHTYPTEARSTLLSAESRMRLMQLEKVKAHSAAQKQSETSNQTGRDKPITPKSGAPARSFSAPSVGGSDARQVGDDGDTHAEGMDIQSTLGGSASQVVVHPHAHSKPEAESSRVADRVGQVELSAAEALVAVAADAEAHAAIPATSAAPQVSTGFHHAHHGMYNPARVAQAATGPYMSGGSSSAGYAPPYYSQHPPYAYMHPSQMASHSPYVSHDAFSQGPGYSMPSVRSAHSAPRSVLSAHSHHSGAGAPMRPHHGFFMHPGHHAMLHLPRSGQGEPLHPAVAASAAARWRVEAPVGGASGVDTRRYAPGMAAGQLRR